MNALFQDAVAREKELLTRRKALADELARIDSELEVITPVKEFYSQVRSAKPAGPGVMSVSKTNVSPTNRDLIWAVAKARKAIGPYTHFHLKADLDRDYPSSNIPVKQISNALYKFQKRRWIHCVKKGTGREPNSYETL